MDQCLNNNKTSGHTCYYKKILEKKERRVKCELQKNYMDQSLHGKTLVFLT